MTEKEPDRLEIRFGGFRASAVGTLAVVGLLALIGSFLIAKASGIL